MARVNTHLNFQGQTEEAVTFYAKTFGTEITVPSRYSDMPAMGPGELLADERDLVVHAELPVLAGHVLMATDMLWSMSQETWIGNNTTLCLDVDRNDEADRLYAALSEGGSEGSPMADMPWGAYWGVTLDRYGLRWISTTPTAPEPAAIAPGRRLLAQLHGATLKCRLRRIRFSQCPVGGTTKW